MVMSNFHEMPFVRALLVALVVLFVVGAGMPGGALARVEMRNGHEGDPDDSLDIIGGGGGEDGDNWPDAEGKGFHPELGLITVEWHIQEDGTIFPIFIFSLWDKRIESNSALFGSFDLLRRVQ